MDSRNRGGADPARRRSDHAWSRRRMLGGLALGMGALGALGAATLAPGRADAKTAAEIDAAVLAAREELFRSRDGARELYTRASGVLIIPEVVKASLVLGAAYGEGSLLIAERIYGYWSYFAASIGPQIGGQSASQALFFMTPQALNAFTASAGFEVGLDAEVTVLDAGAELALDSTQHADPIIAMVYDRGGLLGGASLQGGRYTRFTP